MAGSADARELGGLGGELLRALAPVRGPGGTGSSWPRCERGPDMSPLVERVRQLDTDKLPEALASIVSVLFELRAWYCMSVGLFVAGFLEHVATSAPQRELAFQIAQVVEGVLLVHTAVHAPRRALDVLKLLLRIGLVPHNSIVRLESAAACLNVEGQSFCAVPTTRPLDVDSGDEHVAHAAAALRPTPEGRERLGRTLRMLENIVAHVSPGSTPRLFGSSVNGFEITSSDVDCVIVAPDGRMVLEEVDAEIAVEAPVDVAVEVAAVAPAGSRKSRKDGAVAAARRLRTALQSDPLVRNAGLVVMELVAFSRVPVLKCTTTEGLSVDISFDNEMPLHNSALLREYADFDGRVADLGRLVKLWACSRRVNSVLEGTISSYSHVLLVIHYLQHIGLVPNLQDKSIFPARCHNEAGLVDGLHDVWFGRAADARLFHQLDLVLTNATLESLLFGFFRYFAYSFPLYSHVVSIRLQDGIMTKPEYFRLHSSSSISDVQVAESASGHHCLHSTERNVQRRLHERLTLCIDDPMERGRCLGPTFKGMERLMYEWRRACEILRNGCDKDALHSLLGQQAPLMSLNRLLQTPAFPSLVHTQHTRGDVQSEEVEIPRGERESEDAEWCVQVGDAMSLDRALEELSEKARAELARGRQVCFALEPLEEPAAFALQPRRHDMLPGDCVEGLWGNEWFSAVVRHVITDHLVQVLWDDGTISDLPLDCLGRPINSDSPSINCPSGKEADPEFVWL